MNQKTKKVTGQCIGRKREFAEVRKQTEIKPTWLFREMENE